MSNAPVKYTKLAYVALALSIFSLICGSTESSPLNFLLAILAILNLTGLGYASYVYEKDQRLRFLFVFVLIVIFVSASYAAFAHRVFSAKFSSCVTQNLDTSNMDLIKEKLAFIRSSYEMFIKWAVILLGAVTFVFREGFFAFTDQQKKAVSTNVHLIFLIWIPLIFSLWYGTRTNEIIVQALEDKQEVMKLSNFQAAWSLQKDFFLGGILAIAVYIAKVLKG
jgi:hypothetical protein